MFINKLKAKYLLILSILLSVAIVNLYSQNSSQANLLNLDKLNAQPNIENTKIIFDVKEVSNNKITIEAQIPSGYYTYIGSPYANTISFSNNNALIETIYPDGIQKNDDVVLYGTQEFTLTLDNGIHIGNTIDISYQLCLETEMICFAPIYESITIEGLETISDNSENTRMINYDKILNVDIENKNIALVGLLIFIAGFLSSLLPCSYPLIPITISIVSGRNITNTQHQSDEKIETKTIVLSSLFFSLGLIFTYTLMGIIISLAGYVLGETIMFGAIGYNPIFLSIVVVFLMFFALSMFGIYDIHAPNFLERIKNRNVEKSLNRNKVSILNKFIIGSLMAVVASPCAAPVVATIIEIGLLNPSRSIIYMTLYGFGFSSFLFIIGISSSSLIGKLPKSGSWMNIVRLVFTTAMFAIVFYYLNTLLKIFGLVHYSSTLAIIIIFIITTIAHIIRRQKIFIEKKLIIVVYALLAILIVTTLAYNTIKPKEEQSISLEQALVLAKEENKNILIDFTAVWCINCKELKDNVLSNDKLKGYIKENYIFVEIDVDKQSDIAKKYNVGWLPWILVLDTNGKPLYIKNRFGSFDDKMINLILEELKDVKGISKNSLTIKIAVKNT